VGPERGPPLRLEGVQAGNLAAAPSQAWSLAARPAVAVAADLGMSSRYYDRRSLNYGAKVRMLPCWGALGHERTSEQTTPHRR
jgi:hypothetical protein